MPRQLAWPIAVATPALAARPIIWQSPFPAWRWCSRGLDERRPTHATVEPPLSGYTTSGEDDRHHEPQDEPHAGHARRRLKEPTARERRVAELIAQGMSNRHIAELLGISYDTARRHSSRLRGKLGLDNAAALACADMPSDAATLRRVPAIAALMSPAEIAVLALVCRGLSTKRIARELGLSPRTVDKHREHLLRKTGTRTVRALAAWTAERYALCGIAAAETGQ